MPTPPERNDRSPPRTALRTWLAALGALAFLAVAAVSFWHQDWRYSLPTPRPRNLVQATLGTVVPEQAPAVAELRAGGRPLFLHFTSSECPCSRFAVDHVRSLVREFGARARFIVVEQGEGGSGAELGLPELADRDGRIARRFGVYSTPQAVLLAGDETLWYRGNYNASRFCSDPRSAFARRALAALLAGEPQPDFGTPATLAYGCALPSAAGAP